MTYGIEVKGAEQLGRVGTALQPLEIVVRYESGEPVFDLPVKFRLISGNGRFEHRDGLTDIQGGAIAEFVPEQAGPYRIDCLVGGKGGQAVHFTGTIDEPSVVVDETAPELQPAEAIQPEDAAERSTESIMAEVDAYLDGLREPPESVREPETAATDAVEAVGSPETEMPATPAAPEPEPLPETATAGEIPAMEAGAPSAVEEDSVIVDLQQLGEQERQPEANAAPVAGTDAPLPEPEQIEPLPETPPSDDRTDAAARAGLDWPKTGGKIGIAVLSLVIALALFGLVRHIVHRPAAPAATTSGSIHCSSSNLQQVGHTYVFTNCTVKP